MRKKLFLTSLLAISLGVSFPSETHVPLLSKNSEVTLERKVFENTLFPETDFIKTSKDLWIQIYTSPDILVYDSWDSFVYTTIGNYFVFDPDKTEKEIEREIDLEVRGISVHYKQILMNLDSSEEFSQTDQVIYHSFLSYLNTPLPDSGQAREDLLLEKRENLKSKLGLNEKTRDAFIRFGRYSSMIDSVFHEYSLPEELKWLVMVESFAQEDVVSPQNAIGLWQILPATARLQNRRLKESYGPEIFREKFGRNLFATDPVGATVLAANILNEYHGIVLSTLQKYNKESNAWPFTLISYIFGPENTVRAIDTYKGDLDKVVQNYHKHNPRFGPYTRTYYSKFLAACEIASNIPYFFGNIIPEGPAKFTDPPVHIVNRGETLSWIARQYDTTPREIAQASMINQNSIIRPGQELIIPK